jgi:hypothetical protein
VADRQGGWAEIANLDRVHLLAPMPRSSSIPSRGWVCRRAKEDNESSQAVLVRDVHGRLLSGWGQSSTPIHRLGLIMQRATPLSAAEGNEMMMDTDGYPDWDYLPPNDDGCPFEPKGCDWGRLPDGRLVALDYSATVW